MLHALGHDLTHNEKLYLKRIFPDDKVVYAEYIKLLTEWILCIDNDVNVEKAFLLMDKDHKGCITLSDLREIRDEIGYTEDDITDAEMADMLKGAQRKDIATELEEQYEARQIKTRHRRGQGYATQEVLMGPLGLPYGAKMKRTSSELVIDPKDQTVNLDCFKRMLQLSAPPAETF